MAFATYDVREAGEYVVIGLRPSSACEGSASSGLDATSNADLEALRGVSRISGNLTLSGAGITSLEALSCLVEVEGNLTVRGTGLTNLTGLSSLTLVGFESGHSYSDNGSLQVTGNLTLSDVTLPALMAAPVRASRRLEHRNRG